MNWKLSVGLGRWTSNDWLRRQNLKAISWRGFSFYGVICKSTFYYTIRVKASLLDIKYLSGDAFQGV